MRIHPLSLIALVLLVSGILAPSPAPAATPEESRTVGEFRFLTAGTLQTPFISTHFRNSTGLGIATGVDLPVLIIEGAEGVPDTLLSINGDLLVVALDFEYQYAVSSRVALRATFRSMNRVGTGLEAFIAQGFSTIMNASVGASVRLLQSDSVLLSGTADLGHVNSLFIDVTTFVKDVTEGNLENASVVQSGTGALGSLGLSCAWATSRWTGLTAFARVAGSNALRDDFSGQWAAGAGYSLDWGQKGGWPVGLLVQGIVEETTDDGRDGGLSGEAGFSVHYTGREELDLYLHLGNAWIPREEPQLTLNATTVTIGIRYYF